MRRFGKIGMELFDLREFDRDEVLQAVLDKGPQNISSPMTTERSIFPYLRRSHGKGKLLRNSCG